MTSSTSPKSSEKEKTLYLRSTDSLWYVINTSEEERHGEEKLTVFSTMPRIFSDKMSRHRLCFVGWESVIYAFTGGSREAKSEIFYLDTRCPDLGWKKGLAMRVQRQVPVCAVFDRGIYVMGNSNTSHLDAPWVEVFDPSLNESRFPYNLGPTPNYSTCHHVRRAIVYGDMTLLVQFERDDSLYCYDLDDGSWTLIDEEFSQATNIIDNSLVVVEGILYCFDRRVLAYDLAKRIWFSEPVMGLNKEGVSPILHETNGWGSPDRNYPDAYLVHVGNGKLCLVWSARDYDSKSLIVHCTKFRVYKDDDGGDNSTLHAIIDSFEIYTIHNCNTSTSIAEFLTI